MEIKKIAIEIELWKAGSQEKYRKGGRILLKKPNIRSFWEQVMAD